MKKTVVGNNIAVIGSGIGGLSTGILLELLGYNVTVVEKNPLPGGLMRSYRRFGIDCPVGVHYVGALGENEPLGRIFGILGIGVDDLFAPMGQDGVTDRYIFDSFIFDLPQGLDAYEKNLKTSFPGETAAIDQIMGSLRAIARRMLDYSFLLNQGDPFQNIEYFNPMGEYLQKLSVSNGLRAVLGMPAHLIGVPLSVCPVIFHHMVLAGYLFSCWRLKENGGKMADAFARRFTSLGGKLILNDGCEKILSRSGKVTGLALKSGITLPADAVVAAIHPKTMLALLEPEDLKSSYRQRVSSLTETDGVIVVQVSIAASVHPEMPYNIYRSQLNEQGELSDGVFYQLRFSNDAGASLLSIITKSSYAEWIKWEKTTSGKRGRDYEEKKLGVARDLLTAAGLVLGNLQNPRILDVFTPLTLRDYVHCAEGSCYGLMRSASQMMKIASLSNVPLTGLYLAGQNTVAPGVLGTMLGSFNAAGKIAGAGRLAGELQSLEKLKR